MPVVSPAPQISWSADLFHYLLITLSAFHLANTCHKQVASRGISRKHWQKQVFPHHTESLSRGLYYDSPLEAGKLLNQYDASAFRHPTIPTPNVCSVCFDFTGFFLATSHRHMGNESNASKEGHTSDQFCSVKTNI